MIDNIDDDILVKTPTMRRIPVIVSARAIGICISGGNPMLFRNSKNPGLNFPVPLAMNITPMAVLNPQKAMSCSLFS